mgnify:CR=1 FL=1|tara:strand:- start:6363 stop:6518 length:156 start_codon:yes stop_codon:yes gene_type:complete
MNIDHVKRLAEIAEIVGSLSIQQFKGDQEAYRTAIMQVFSAFAFDNDEESN